MKTSMIVLKYHARSCYYLTVSVALRAKATEIRSYLAAGAFSTTEIAALVKTSPRVVRAVRQAARKGPRLESIERRLAELEAGQRAILSALGSRE